MDEQNQPVVASDALSVPEEIPQWFRSTVAKGVELLLINGMNFAPRGEAVDGSIALFQRGLWMKGLDEGETWNELRDQWRIAETFNQHLAHATRYPFLKNLLWQMPEREEDPEVIERRYQRYLARQKEVEDRLDNPPAEPIKLLASAGGEEGMKRPDREERDKKQRAATVGQINRLQNILHGKEGAA